MSKGIDKAIFHFVFQNAMRDATLQQAYKGEKAWLKDIEKLGNTEKYLERFINKVLDGKVNNQTKYDTLFLETSKDICNEIKLAAKNEEFTFGNAQKLINIMIKYFYIMTYNDTQKKERFQYCHCPMDRIMLEKVWRDYKKYKGEEKVDLKTLGEFKAGWGKENFEDGKVPERYYKYQIAVRQLSKEEGITPLQYDYKHWRKE